MLTILTFTSVIINIPFLIKKTLPIKIIFLSMSENIYSNQLLSSNRTSYKVAPCSTPNPKSAFQLPAIANKSFSILW